MNNFCFCLKKKSQFKETEFCRNNHLKNSMSNQCGLLEEDAIRRSYFPLVILSSLSSTSAYVHFGWLCMRECDSVFGLFMAIKRKCDVWTALEMSKCFHSISAC